MSDATVTHLFTTPAMSQAMVGHESVSARAGEGIDGDRYLLKTGAYSKKPEPGRQITLVEGEILSALKERHGLTVLPEDCRRNVVTRGIELNPLVGREIAVGPVRLKAHRLCQPCRYIEKLLGQPGLYGAWWDKGGIRCEIIVGGAISVGDAITALKSAETAM